jgi:hypothetical protein
MKRSAADPVTAMTESGVLAPKHAGRQGDAVAAIHPAPQAMVDRNRLDFAFNMVPHRRARGRPLLGFHLMNQRVPVTGAGAGADLTDLCKPRRSLPS